jgi:hypothetical protein
MITNVFASGAQPVGYVCHLQEIINYGLTLQPGLLAVADEVID